MAETVRALRVLAAIESELAQAQRNRAWYAERKVRAIDGLTLRDAMTASQWYEERIAAETVVIDAYRKVLGEPWAVSSDELPDLAAGDHYAGMDEDGPPADINREGLPEFNGAFR